MSRTLFHVICARHSWRRWSLWSCVSSSTCHELFFHLHVSRTLLSTCLTNSIDVALLSHIIREHRQYTIALSSICHELYHRHDSRTLLMLLCYLISYVNIVKTPLLYHLYVTNSIIYMTHELYWCCFAISYHTLQDVGRSGPVCVCVCVCVVVCVGICVGVCVICVCMYICVCVCVCVGDGTRVYMCIFIYTSMYTCMYVYI